MLKPSLVSSYIHINAFIFANTAITNTVLYFHETNSIFNQIWKALLNAWWRKRCKQTNSFQFQMFKCAKLYPKDASKHCPIRTKSIFANRNLTENENSECIVYAGIFELSADCIAIIVVLCALTKHSTDFEISYFYMYIFCLFGFSASFRTFLLCYKNEIFIWWMKPMKFF